MEFEIGKVISFDGYCGKVVSENGEYLFLNGDIEQNISIEVGSLIAFRGEKIQGQGRAFFIKNAEDVLKSEKNKEKVYRDL